MKIAFLEDNKLFADEVIQSLTMAGHEVDLFGSGRACLAALAQTRYDMCIFDWEVPDMNGTEVMANLKLRGEPPPIIFLTGRDAEEDVVKVLEAGADDYIVKPPNTFVLIARVNAVARRIKQANQDKQEEFGNLRVDYAKRVFQINGAPVKLTEKETELALYFFGQQGVLLSRAHLIKVVWGSSPDIDTRTIDVHVSHLRNKLQLLPEFGWRLISVYHQGYRLERLG